MTKKALIVVDIQNDYFPGGKWTLSGVEAAASNAARLIADARKAGDLVVHIRHEFPTTDAPFFQPESEGAALHPSVMNLESEHVVLKHRSTPTATPISSNISTTTASTRSSSAAT